MNRVKNRKTIVRDYDVPTITEMWKRSTFWLQQDFSTTLHCPEVIGSPEVWDEIACLASQVLVEDELV